MDPLRGIIAFGIWPALPLSGYWLYTRANRPLRTSSLPSLTLFALIVGTGITLFSLPMLLSAALGLYRADFFGAIGWIITILSLWKLSRKKEMNPTLGAIRLKGWNLVLAAGLIVAALLYLGFPAETILGGRDEGVYANHGIYISKHGRVDVPYPYPSELDPMFKEAIHSTPEIYKTFMPGFYITSPTMKVQFGHLFPTWLAQVYSTFGHRGLFRFNALLALLSLCVFYGLCCSLIPKPYAVISTLFLALNPAQLWMARITLTEILTQLFIGSGLVLFVLALKHTHRNLGRFAGIFVGFSAVVRIDSLFLLPLFLLSHLVLKMIEGPEKEGSSTIWSAFYQTLLPLFGFAVEYYALFSTPYLISLHQPLLMIGILSLCLFLALRLPIDRAWNVIRTYLTVRSSWTVMGIALAVLTVYAYWVRPYVGPYSLFNHPGHFLHGTRTYREDSLINLARYLSPLVVWTAVIGCFIMFRNMVWDRRYLHLIAVFTTTMGVSILYLWNPSIAPDHFWAVRRFVPVVIPGMILFSTFGLWCVMSKVPKTLSIILSLLILLYLSFFTIKSDAIIFNFAENRGSFKQIEELADHLPKDEITLSDRGDCSPTWETPLYLSFDRRIIPVDLSSPAGVRAAKAWLEKATAEKRPFYLLYEGRSILKGLASSRIYEIELSREVTEPTVYPLPKAILREERRIGFYEINGIRSDCMNVSLGAERYFGVLESGFQGQEWNGNRPFRWTDGNAKLIVPLNAEHLPRALRVEILSHCPKELKMKVLLNHRELYQGLALPGKNWSETFSLPAPPVGKEAIIEIISDTFVPREMIKGSVDARTLGVTVQDIRLLERNEQ